MYLDTSELLCPTQEPLHYSDGLNQYYVVTFWCIRYILREFCSLILLNKMLDSLVAYCSPCVILAALWFKVVNLNHITSTLVVSLVSCTFKIYNCILMHVYFIVFYLIPVDSCIITLKHCFKTQLLPLHAQWVFSVSYNSMQWKMLLFLMRKTG